MQGLFVFGKKEFVEKVWTLEARWGSLPVECSWGFRFWFHCCCSLHDGWLLDSEYVLNDLSALPTYCLSFYTDDFYYYAVVMCYVISVQDGCITLDMSASFFGKQIESCSSVVRYSIHEYLMFINMWTWNGFLLPHDFLSALCEKRNSQDWLIKFKSLMTLRFS